LTADPRLATIASSVIREPNDVRSRDAGGVGAATCRACSETLAPDAAYCHQCGYAQADDNWAECEISYRRDRLHGEFTAVYRGEAPWSVAGRSEQFLWVGRGGEPPRTAAAEDRLARLCRELEREGWKAYDTGPVAPWYRLTFGRGIGAPGHEQVGEVNGSSDLEAQPNLTLVPVEEVAEQVEVAAEAEPAEAEWVHTAKAVEPDDVPVAGVYVPVAEVYAPVAEADVPIPEADVPIPEAEVPVPEAYVPSPEAELRVAEIDTSIPEADLPVPEVYAPIAETYIPVAEEPQFVPVQQSAELTQAALPQPPMEPHLVALEAPEQLYEPDPEPPVSLDDDGSEALEDVVVGPWYREPPRPAPVTALTEESDLCSRISVYSAKTA
jgi:hypothetical protein